MSFTSEAAPSARPASVGMTAEPATVIDANTTVDGMLSTSHDLRVEGHVTGTVMCDGVLHIAEGAGVDATVEASGIIVAGSLSGTITCHGRLEIRSTGVVRGRVDTGRLIVVEGAVYEGQLRMDGPPEPVDQDEPPVEPDEAESAAQPSSTGSYSFLRNFSPGTPPAPPADDVLPGSPDEEDPD